MFWETQDIKQPTEQLTQKEVYEYILADLDAAIELNALPQSAVKPNALQRRMSACDQKLMC